MPKPKTQARLAGIQLRLKRRSVLRGMARIGDLRRQLSQTDLDRIFLGDSQQSLAEDWNRVGAEVGHAITEYEKQRKAG